MSQCVARRCLRAAQFRHGALPCRTYASAQQLRFCRRETFSAVQWRGVSAKPDIVVEGACDEICGTLSFGDVTTVVLLAGVQYAPNIGGVLRHVALLSPSAAVLLGTSNDESVHGNVVDTRLLCEKARRMSGLGEAVLDKVPLAVVQDMTATVRWMQTLGFVTVGLENVESCSGGAPVVPIWDGMAPMACKRLLLISGAEAAGVPIELLDLCDFQCFIPSAVQQGSGIAALNVAGATEIALYERTRRLAMVPVDF